MVSATLACMTDITMPNARQERIRTKRRILSLVAAVALHAVAWRVDAHEGTHGQPADIGRAGNAAEVTRDVEITMDDSMRFRPASIQVSRGETVRFILKNTGSVQHEFVLGNEKELAAHAAMMRRMPNMRHADPNMMTLPAGRAGELVWHFSTTGAVGFACLQPGHYDAGMKGEVVVSGPPPASQRAPRP